MRIADGITLTLAVGVLALAGGCDGTEPGTSSLTVRLTDAPGDVKAAVVTISEVYLTGGGAEGEGLEDADGRVVLSSEPRTVDLLTLADDATTLASAVDIPSRHYGQLRFVITGAYLEVENDDGSTSIFASTPDYAGLPEGAVVSGELGMPSLAQSGLKVQLPDGALDLDDEEASVLVDFDVAQSFGHGTGSGDWVMHPVVTGEREE